MLTSSKLLAVGAFFGLAAAKLQIMVVYDMSQGASQETKMRTAFVEGLKTTISSLAETDIEFALATSADKPAPYLGVGTYGGYPGTIPEDYCYKRELDFTTDYEAISSKVLTVDKMNGLDDVQGQLEGVVNALYDPNVQWDMSDSTDRLVITVTDNWAHSGQDDTSFADLIRLFNQPVRCTGGSTAGGFGAVKPNFSGYSWYLDQNAYNRYAQLHYIRACSDEGLTDEEQAEYSKLRATYPVRQYPVARAYNKDTIIADSDSHCRYHAYPRFQDVTAAFAEKNAKWIVLNGDVPGSMVGATWMYASTVSDWGFAPTPMAVANVANKNTITADETAKLLTQAFKALNVGN